MHSPSPIIYYMSPGIVIYSIDLLSRIYRSNVRVTRVVNVRPLTSGMTQITFECIDPLVNVHPWFKFNYKSGQYLFLNFPEISLFQWHPFSISSPPPRPNDSAISANPLVAYNTPSVSSSNGTFYTIHIKESVSARKAKLPDARGKRSWTKKLSDTLKSGKSLSVRMDGAYGSPPEFMDFHNIVLIAGGAGTTPWNAVLLDAIRHYPSVKKIFVIWSFRTETDLMWYIDTFIEVHEGGHIASGRVDFNLFVSQKKSGNDVEAGGSSVARPNGNPYQQLPPGSPRSDGYYSPAAPSPRTPMEFEMSNYGGGVSGGGYKPAGDEKRSLSVPADIQTRSGRPNYTDLFSMISTKAESLKPVTKVLVMVCGPAAMVKEANVCSTKFTNKKIVFHCHAETFEF